MKKELIDKIWEQAQSRVPFLCEECGGSGYYPTYQGVVGAECPSCNGTGQNQNVSLADLLMGVNLSLCRAWKCQQDGFIETGDEDFKFTGLDSMEYHLASAVVKLVELAGWKGIEIKRGLIPLDHRIFDDVAWFLLIANGEVWEIFKQTKMYTNEALDLTFKVSNLLQHIFDFANHHTIPLEKHVEELIAYQRR